MTNDEWIAALGELPPEHRVLAELLMERVNTVIISHVNRQLDDIQRIERRIEVLRSLIAEARSAIEVIERQRTASE